MKLMGNTPMIKINYEYNGKKKYLYAKLEYYNPSGSIKDRVALYIINNAIKRGELNPNMPIIEATSGNTGIALAALGAKMGYPVYIFMPDWASKERKDLMKLYGANLILVSKEEGGFIECVKRAKKMAEEKNGFLANQFANKDNFQAHYETTGEEIVNEIPEEIGSFISGVGTGGTLMGTGTKIKEKYNNSKIIAIEPDKMPIISGGQVIGNHKIEGIGDDFVPDLLDKSKIDNIYLINDDDAINMSKKLAKELGLGVGISSGANFIGCAMQNDIDENPATTVFSDDNKKYLSTDLNGDISKNEEYVSNKIKLINYEVINN